MRGVDLKELELFDASGVNCTSYARGDCFELLDLPTVSFDGF
jgi:hypothetical protein